MKDFYGRYSLRFFLPKFLAVRFGELRNSNPNCCRETCSRFSGGVSSGMNAMWEVGFCLFASIKEGG